MAIELLSVSSESPFKQGEILSECNELSFEFAPIVVDQAESTEVAVQVIKHQYVLLLAPDCDLEQDFKARVAKLEGFESAFRNDGERSSFRDKGEKNELSNVIVSPLWSMEQFKKLADQRTHGQVRKSNNHPRWCHVGPVSWNEAGDKVSTSFILDCGYLFTWPMQLVHNSLLQSNSRKGYLPSPYREHYLQRFFGWQSRIGVDDIPAET